MGLIIFPNSIISPQIISHPPQRSVISAYYLAHGPPGPPSTLQASVIVIIAEDWPIIRLGSGNTWELDMCGLRCNWGSFEWIEFVNTNWCMWNTASVCSQKFYIYHYVLKNSFEFMDYIENGTLQFVDDDLAPCFLHFRSGKYQTKRGKHCAQAATG